MNDFKKIIPKKNERKRASSLKRNNSFTEESKNNNSKRFFKYEVFEKLNSKLNKKQKLRANSSSKKKRKSKSKNNSLESKKKKNSLDNNYTYNTQFTTLDTDIIKNKIKKSPRKEEFSKILSKAKDLLSIQSDIILECGKLNKTISKMDIEIESKLKNEMNNNGTNVLPGLAKALYLLECKRGDKNGDKISNRNSTNILKKKEEIDNSFYIIKLNELNGFIGELGYSYVYNEFDNENYKKENLIIYFDNIQKLINILHQTVNNQNEILIKQENKIKEYENIINKYQEKLKECQKNTYNNNTESNDIQNKTWKFDADLISRNSKKDDSNENNSLILDINKNENLNINRNRNNKLILINENMNNNDSHAINNDDNNCNYDSKKYNYTDNTFFRNSNSHEFDKIDDCNNVFRDNSNEDEKQHEIPQNTHYFNSYINKLSFPQQNQENQGHEFENYKENINRNSENFFNKELDNNYSNKQSLPPETTKNYLNYYNKNNNNVNDNENLLSGMLNSESFFESYKRNKELKNNLNFNYNDKVMNDE